MRTLHFFTDWGNPTNFAGNITQSDGLNSDLNAQALTSKDYHKYEPRRAKVKYFRDTFTTNQVFSFNYITNGGDVSTKWNNYKACVKDGDTILFRGLIDNSSVDYSKGRYKCSFTLHDIINLLNDGLDNVDKSYTWNELGSTIDLHALLIEIIEGALEYSDRDLITPTDWYSLNFTIPTFTFSNALTFDIQTQDEVDAVLEDPFSTDQFSTHLRDDGDAVRLYYHYRVPLVTGYLHIYSITYFANGQAVNDWQGSEIPDELITNSGYTVNSFPLTNNLSLEKDGISYKLASQTGEIRISGTTQIQHVLLDKTGATEAGGIDEASEGMVNLYAGYTKGGKSFSYRDLFNMIIYLWNLSVHTTNEGVIEFTNKHRNGISPSAISLSDSDLSGTKFKSLLYSPPDIDKKMKPLAQSGLNLAIKSAVDEDYKDRYGTKTFYSTLPRSYNLSLESTVTAYRQQYKVTSIKNNKRGTFTNIEGWSE